MLSLHRLLRLKDLPHLLYHYPFIFAVHKISFIINSVKPIPFFLLDHTTKSKSNVILLKAPADNAFGALPVVSAISPLASN